MKPKPLRHKETNTFKFIPFTDRIQNLKTDVFHYVSSVPEDEEQPGTFLSRSIEKWTVQNCTLGMEACLRELPACESLPLVLHNRDQIISVILKHLDMKDPLILQPLLELLVAVSRDLRHEFYPFFSRSLESLFSLISGSRDPDVLEWSFQCVAYLLKFLWRSLLKEPASVVYERALPLLQDNKPPYIKEFAAQCFAFVARKVRDKPGFISAMLTKLQDTQDGVSGTGRLICETLCGVSGTLHSSAPTLLRLLLMTLGSPVLPSELLAEVMNHAVQGLAAKLKPANWSMFWEVALDVLQELRDSKNLLGVTKLLILLRQAVDIKRGSSVTDPNLFIKALTPLLAIKPSDQISTALLKEAIRLTASLLCSQYLSLSQEQTALLSSQIMSTESPDLLLEFIHQVLNCPGFEIHILPKFLKFCENTMKSTPLHSQSILQLLAKVVTEKSPVCHSGLELPAWKMYSLDLPEKSDIFNFIIDQLDFSDQLAIEELMASLLITPHLKYKSENVKMKLHSLIKKLCEDVGTDKMKLFILSLAVESSVHLNLNFDDLLEPILVVFNAHSQDLAALRMLDLVLTSRDHRDETLYEKLMEQNLHHNVASPFHKVRVLTSHILSLVEPGSLFSHLLKTENTPATIDNYRDRLQKIGALEPAFLPTTSQQNDQKTQESALLFLIGQLYVNFRLVWDPVSEQISSYAHTIPRDTFWPIMVQQLILAAERINTKCEQDETTSQLSIPCLSELYRDLEGQMDVPDHVNFRCLLWSTLSLFSDLCESKSRDITPLFLDFLNNEFYNSESSDSYFWNVIRTSPEEDSKMEVDEDSKTKLLEESKTDRYNEDQENDDDDDFVKTSKPKSRGISKSLIAHLQLIAKLRNPKSMFREKELSTVYYDLLKYRNSSIQKLALDCIMQYKNTNLTTYKEQLYNLVEDKGFKSQLLMFNIESEGEAVQPEHRADLIPVLMSILYSKMQAKSKQSGSSKRSTILRFLSGCKQEELLIFLHLAFKHYLNDCHESENLIDMVHRVMKCVNLERVTPAKRLTSAINLVNLVLAHLGRQDGGMGECTSLLLKVLLVISAQITGVLLRREEIGKFAITALRGSRKTVIDAIGRIFARGNAGDSTTVYHWHSEQFDAIFEAIVWPAVERLEHECLDTPTALLRLFVAWSENPKYFPLLVKHHEEKLDCTPLSRLVSLLCIETVRSPVTSAVLDVCQRLLTLVPDESMELDGEELQVTNVTSVDQQAVDKLTLSEPLNYGSQLLLPHVPTILSYLHRRAAILHTKKKSHGSLSARDLTVLSRISELVTDPGPSLSLLQLIIPICLKKAQRGAGDAALLPLLTTAENLLRCIDNPEQFTLQLIPLFSTVNGRNSRQLLCNILFKLIHKKDAKVIADLNSWDTRQIDEPNFERRINAFSKVTSSVNEIELQFGLMIIHCCFYTLRIEKDISLRDCASHCLQVLGPALAHKYAEDPEKRALVLERTIIEVLRRGMKDKKEEVQQDMLALLGVMVRTCSNLHPTLKDLEVLACESDMEKDFFENLRHLQLHRRSRALLRFSQVVRDDGAKIRPQTLGQFILPLASNFLCNEKYGRVHTLVDAAIEAVGVICTQLPWQQYEAVLKFQLARLPKMFDYQKQLVRTVIVVLDAYHFDLSNIPATKPITKKNKFIKKTEVVPSAETGDVKTEENVVEIVEDTTEKSDEIVGENLEEKSDEIVGAGDDLNENLGEKSETVDEKNDEKSDEKGEDDILDENLDEDEVKDETDELLTILESTKCDEVILNKPLSVSLAIKVRHTILQQFLPKLHQIISARLATDMTHKLNKRTMDRSEEREREAQEVLKVPIALAIVKLLQKLPHGALEQQLGGVLLKVCMFLKSRLESTRRAARETLQEILRTLGPKYLVVMMSELTSLLTRGYLVHVLVYTVHSLIVTAAEILKPGDIDPCLASVLNVCKADMFGEASEEKEIAQIAGKVKEARSHKSYDTLKLVSKFTSERCLTDLLLPLKEVLGGSNSYKLIQRVATCLQFVVQGLAENTFVPAESLLMFAYGAASESLPALITANKSGQDKEPLTLGQKAIQRVDTFLIAPAPKRSGPIVRKSVVTHAHHFVGFGLQLLFVLLKRERTSGVPNSMLDPFVPVLTPALKSQHTKLTTLALSCLAWMLKLDLPSLKTVVPEITKVVFKLLHKFAGAGTKGDNFDMANAAFKVVGVIVRDVEYHHLTKDQARLLLLYAERDVQATDGTRQATAFTLLKAILRRRIQSPELAKVLMTIGELAIVSSATHVRQQARQVFLFYLLEYQIKKKVLEEHLTFLLSQLDFELQSGRVSSLEMLQTLVSSFPQPTLATHSGLIFVAVAARLVNDDDPECRKMAATLLKNLLLKVGHDSREQLFGATLLWFNDAKLEHRRLAAQLCGIFLTIETSSFESRLSTLLPIISSNLSSNTGPGRFVKAPEPEETEEISTEGGNPKDHLLFQILQLLVKISSQCPKWLNSPKYRTEVLEITAEIQPLLVHPHEWVRLGSAQLLGCIFGILNPATIANAIQGIQDDTCLFMLQEDTKSRIRSLTLDLCDQLQPGEIKQEFAEQVVKNLVYLSRVFKHIQVKHEEVKEEELTGEETMKVSLLWLAKRMRRAVNVEVTQTPGKAVVRSAVLKWVAGTSLDMGETLSENTTLLHHILAPVAREINLPDTNHQAPPQLRRLAKEVAALVKQQIGVENFARAMTKLQIKSNERKATRKRKMAQQVVTDPEKSARRKIRQQQVKKHAKRRRIDVRKGRVRKNFRDTGDPLSV